MKTFNEPFLTFPDHQRMKATTRVGPTFIRGLDRDSHPGIQGFPGDCSLMDDCDLRGRHSAGSAEDRAVRRKERRQDQGISEQFMSPVRELLFFFFHVLGRKLCLIIK